MRKQKAKKHRPSYAFDQSCVVGNDEHYDRPIRPASSSSAHQLKTIVTKLTRELPLTTQSRKALSFPSLLESLSQHLTLTLFVANDVAKADNDDCDIDDMEESLRQVHTLLLLALSYHAQRCFHNNNTHNRQQQQQQQQQQSLAPLSWLASMIQVLSQLYHLQLQQQEEQQHLQVLVTQADWHESSTILLQTLIKWSALVLSSSSSSSSTPNQQHYKKEEIEILMGLVELTYTLWSCCRSHDHHHYHHHLHNYNVQPQLSEWFQHEYGPRVLQKLVSSPWLSPHQKNQIQKTIQVLFLQEPQRSSNNGGGDLEIGEAKLGQCKPTKKTADASNVKDEEYDLVADTSSSAVMMNLPMNIVRLLASTDNNTQMFHANDTALTADQVKQSISALLRRILQPEYEHNCPADWEMSRREALQLLLPLLEFFLLSGDTWSMIIPTADWVAIAKTLLQDSSDDQVVHDATRMLCRLLPDRLKATMTTIFHQHVSLLSAMAMVLVHPFTSIQIKSEILHVLFRLTHGDDDHEYQLHHALFLSQMARAPMVLQAVSHILATSSTMYSSQQQRHDRHRAMSILMALSRPVSNHRIVAQQSGVLSSMIRFVRQYEEHDDNNNQNYLGQTLRGGREALKERILQVAEAL